MIKKGDYTETLRAPETGVADYKVRGIRMREMVRRRILWIGIIMLWNAFFLTGCSQGNSSDQEELCENETIAASREHYKGNDFLEVQEEINIRVAEPEATTERSHTPFPENFVFLTVYHIP